MKKFISIIVPLFNNQNIVKKLIKNLNNINSENIEILLVDDCSKDKTFSILRKYVIKKKNILLFKTSKNGGPGIARNIGIKKSNSQNIIFLDSDDKIVVKQLKRLEKFLINKKFNICFYNRHEKKNFVTNKAKWVKNFFLKSFRREVIFGVYNRKFLIKNKIFFKEGFFEDLPFLLKTLIKNKNKIIFYNENVYKKNNKNNKSISRQISKKHLLDKINAWKNSYLIAKNNKVDLSKNLLNFRMRGEFVFIYEKIIKIKNKVLAKKLTSILLSQSKKYVNKSGIYKTKIDLKYKKYFLNEKI